MTNVSVIIPCYNPRDYLLAAVESVMAQTAPAHELIIINDGSNPECTPLFEQLRARYPTITIIDLPSNRGVAHARNTGISRARGELIAFLDQDDLWAPEKLALQGAYFHAHPECAYVTSRQRYFLSQGLNAAPSWVKPEHIDASLSGFLPGTLMVRATSFQAIGLFDESLKAGTDDVDWFFRAKQAGLTTHELPQELLYKRIHQGNLSVNARAHNHELLSVVKMNLARRKQQKISVIIPCYNGKKYIAEALASVIAQGDAIGEVIVVDDASTDGSADYVQSLHHAKIKLHRLPENKGIGGARNAGIALAVHPLIAFLDADDLWPEGRTGALLSALEQTGVPWVFGAIEHFSSSDHYALPPPQTGYFASAMLVHADFFRRVGLFNEALRVGEFIDWFDRARQHHAQPAVIQDIVLRRRIHGENSSIVAGNKNTADYLKVARAAIERKRQRATS